MAFCISYVHGMHVPGNKGEFLCFSPLPSFTPFVLSLSLYCICFPQIFWPKSYCFPSLPIYFSFFPVPFSPSYFSLLSFCPISSFKPFFTLYSVLPSCNLSLKSTSLSLFQCNLLSRLIFHSFSVVFLVFLPCDPTDQWPQKQVNIQSIHYTFLSQVIRILFMSIICISKEMRLPKWSQRPWGLEIVHVG